MSNLWISAKSSYVPGVQLQTIVEPSKVQAMLSLNSFNYAMNTNAQAMTESSKAQASLSLSSFNYA